MARLWRYDDDPWVDDNVVEDDDDERATIALQRHREVIRELLQNHRESVQCQRRAKGLITYHGHTTRSLTVPPEKVEEERQVDIVTSSQGLGQDGYPVWRREPSLRRIHPYQDDDFVLLHRDEFLDALERQRSDSDTTVFQDCLDDLNFNDVLQTVPHIPHTSPILSLSDLPPFGSASSTSHVDEEQEASSSDPSTQEVQRKIDDILDNLFDTIETHDPCDSANSSKSPEAAQAVDSDSVLEVAAEPAELRSESHHEAINDILDGFFGAMNSLDDAEIDHDVDAFPSPPRHRTLSTEHDERIDVDDDYHDYVSSSSSSEPPSESSASVPSEHVDENSDINKSVRNENDQIMEAGEYAEPMSNPDETQIDGILDSFLDKMDIMDSNQAQADEKERSSARRVEEEEIFCPDASEASEFSDSTTDANQLFTSQVENWDAVPSAPLAEAESLKPSIGIGGDKSVFTSSLGSALGQSNGPNPTREMSEAKPTSAGSSPRVERRVVVPAGMALEDVMGKQVDGGTTTFTPLHISESRITSPDFNAMEMNTTWDTSEIFSPRDDGIEDDRPHDPIATALSKDLSDGEQDDADFLTVDETPPSELARDTIPALPPSPVPPKEEEPSMDIGAPLSPPRPARASAKDDVYSIMSGNHVPEFDLHSVSTMSGSPLSHAGVERAGSDSKTPDAEIAVIEIEPTQATMLPNLFGEEKRRETSSPSRPAAPKTTNSPHRTPTTAPPKIPLRFDSSIPFARTNNRMNRRKDDHKDTPTTPHMVETSRSPFRDSTPGGFDDGGVSIAALSTHGRANSVISAVRGFHSLASPFRTPAVAISSSPSIRLVSRTPNDNQSTAKTEQMLCRNIATPSYHRQHIRVCTNKFIYNLHPKLGPCDRCWALASPDEQESFLTRGSHLRIVRTRGGCDRSCTIFPPLVSAHNKNGEMKLEEPPVRLCRQCFFSTHQRDGSRVSVYRGNHIQVKTTI